MNTDTLTSMSASIGGGFLRGLLIGYALKKVIKMLAVVVGLFLAGVTFLQYQHIATIHWHKVEGAITKLAATAATTISTINDNNSVAIVATMSNFSIPLTSSMSIGFTIDFMKVNVSNDYSPWKYGPVSEKCIC